MPKTTEEKREKYTRKLKALEELPIKNPKDVNEKWRCPRKKCNGVLKWYPHSRFYGCKNKTCPMMGMRIVVKDQVTHLNTRHQLLDKGVPIPEDLIDI